jgi:two-component sensor histidine kinase
MEVKMHQSQLTGLDLDEKALALLLGEINHRIRNVFTVIQTAVSQTQAGSVEDYRTKLTGRISGLSRHYETGPQLDGGKIRLAQLIEQTAQPHAANGALILADGPDLQLEPKVALALHLVFHELATNAHKYGALSSSSGCVKVEWKVRHNRGRPRQLAISWSEHGGPEVRPSVHRGFGLRLIERVLEGYGGLRLHFNPRGVACFILIELDSAATTRLRSLHSA